LGDETVAVASVVMDSLRSILRAAAVAAFTVGLLLVLLNPPSLSGAGGLLTIFAAAVAFVLVVGWATVALMGSDGPSEEEMERLIRRSEELAASPQLAAAAGEFDLMVADAIDRLPEEFRALLDDTPVVVSQRGWEFHAYGHYYGGGYTRGDYEHRIVLYQDTLERDFGWDPELLRAQVERTLRHELAHHIGWGEPGVRGLGL
jgi:predicted Zn-dependent protease with MMP-like domain